MRMQMVIEALAQSIEKAGSIEAGTVAAQMGKLGDAGVKFEVEGFSYGFRVIKTIASDKAAMATTCKMLRP